MIGYYFYRAMALVPPLTLSSQLPDNANGLIPVQNSDSRGFTSYSAPIVAKKELVRYMYKQVLIAVAWLWRVCDAFAL